MKNLAVLALAALLSSTVACTAQTEPTGGTAGRQTSPVTGQPSDPAPAPAPAPACTPLAGPTGTANPAAVYCAQLGYTLANEECAFPDGTSCEEWSFYRGECGQAHSFCNLHGGTVANKVEDMGTWTASYALCTLPGGASCHEDAFARSCTCE